MRTLLACGLVAAFASSAWAQRHAEGVEASFHAQRIQLIRHQAQGTADMLENSMERRRHLLTDLYPNDRHWVEQQLHSSIKTIRDNSRDVEVRRRNLRSHSSEARMQRERQRLHWANTYHPPVLKQTQRVRPDVRRVRPLTPRDLGRIRPGGGTPRIGTRSITIRFVPPG